MAKSNKYSGHWQAFNKNWFRNNQKKILSWVNGGWIKRKISRYFLRLDTKEDLIEIGPHYYKIGLPDGQLQADFRTHDKYSKRVYYSLFVFWWALHFLDWLMLDKFAPKYSFGFSTLTAYPQAGGGGSNTTCDGYILRYSENSSWSSIRTSSGTNIDVTNGIMDLWNIWSNSGGTTYDNISRGGFTFNTSALGSSATISDAVLSVRGAGKANTFILGDNSIDIVSFSPANDNTFVNGDFVNFGTTSFSNITYSNFLTSASDNNFTLNSSGISNINKTGVTRFGARAGCDRSNTEPMLSAGSMSYVQCWTVDLGQSGPSPKLVITYTEAPAVTYKQPAILVG